MTKKERIAELERKVAELEQQVAAMRLSDAIGRQIVYPVSPYTYPPPLLPTYVTCQSRPTEQPFGVMQ